MQTVYVIVGQRVREVEAESFPDGFARVSNEFGSKVFRNWWFTERAAKGILTKRNNARRKKRKSDS